MCRRTALSSYDAVVGFNKMPGLDLYFASDPCFAARAAARSPWYRLTRRCRIYLSFERAVFHQGSTTEILLLSEPEKILFVNYYGTADQRFHLLPPGIPKNRVAPDNASEVGRQLRDELGIGPTRKVALMVGSGFKTKGVDRAVMGLSALPDELRKQTVLLIVGQGKPGPFRRLARKFGVLEQVRFVGGRNDVNRFLLAADLLIHPAYRENTGSVLVEAMAAGLPVLATDVCGYSNHVMRAGAGRLVPSPYRQEALNELLAFMMTSEKRDEWQRRGREYVAETDVFSLSERAVDVIEQVAG
jgi:UDP-glucose:(heptosyl)LPS alpha-1,3-glucosyltransferase